MSPDFRQSKDFQDYVQGRMLSRRISLLAFVTALVLFSYLVALWYLQVVEADRYAALSEENRIRRVLVRAPRGAILDRNGEILARSRVSFNIVMSPDLTLDRNAAFASLSRVLGTSREEIEERYVHAAARVPRHEAVVIAEDVPLAAVAWLEAHRDELQGFFVRTESLRYYEAGASGAHIVGYVGEISSAELDAGKMEGAIQGDLVGKSGLERYMDASLRGENGYRRVVVNHVGREVNELGTGMPARPGRNIRTSIDGGLQRVLDMAFGSHKGAAVFMDPWTGEILALTSRPGFDSNLFARRFTGSMWRGLVTDPSHPLQNRAVQSGYSPGSTFKPILAMAALEEGVISPSTRFHCGGHEIFYTRRFHCHKREGHGWVDLHTAIMKSCNIYFYNVADMLGIDRIAEYARRFGLSQRTGIPLGSESPGLVPSTTWRSQTTGGKWYPSETISVGIGQGPLLVTPLQQVVMVSALATDGRRPVPTLDLATDAAEEPGGATVIEKLGRPMAREHLDVVRRAMWGVVNEAGTGGRAKMEGFDVCGKTGTAQVVAASAAVDDQDELPEELRDHSWFVGFAPRDHPEVAFAVIVENGGHGSESAAPLAREVLEFFFRSRPTRPVSPGPAPETEVARHGTGGDPRVL